MEVRDVIGVFALLSLATGAVAAEPAFIKAETTKAKGSKLVRAPLGTRGYLLNRMSFTFLGSDHKLRSIGAIPNSRGVIATLRDQNGDDEFNFKSRYLKLNAKGAALLSRPLRASKRGCKGSCFVAVKPPSGRKKLVLLGFKFTRQRGDSNIKTLSITPTLNAFRVIYVDNSEFRFDVDIRYAWADRSLFSGGGTAKTQRSHGRNIAFASARPGFKAILGFHVFFQKGDHYIKTFGVFGNPGKIGAILADGNGDDPFRYSISYGIVRRSMIGPFQSDGNTSLPPAKIRRIKPTRRGCVRSGFSFVVNGTNLDQGPLDCATSCPGKGISAKIKNRNKNSIYCKLRGNFAPARNCHIGIKSGGQWLSKKPTRTCGSR